MGKERIEYRTQTNISNNTPDEKGEVLMTIMAALAQQESESLSANVRLGIQFRNQQGKVQVNHNRTFKTKS